jgi:thymidine phosphorylase
LRRSATAGEFTQEEIRYIIDSTLDGEMPQHQLAALAMAIYFSNMSAQETAILTEEMMLSGEVIDLSHIAKPKIDKYSTGGVGDKTSLVLVPLAMASGVVVPDDVRRRARLRHQHLDKLGSIPGFKGTRPSSISPSSSPASAARSSRRARTSPRPTPSSTSCARTPAPSRASRSSPAACFPRSSPRVPRAS